MSIGGPHEVLPPHGGNPARLTACRLAVGSIPARAGEPRAPPPGPRSARVYPRASGGTPRSSSNPASGRGLSPRERGNPHPGHRAANHPRSIPARAGEPKRRGCGRRKTRVYPRASGGTLVRAVLGDEEQGLSPRERGNHVASRPVAGRAGSIPARAGEPVGVGGEGWSENGLSPRERGTSDKHDLDTPAGGLSPRERGNRSTVTPSWSTRRSIPARAGEPYSLRANSSVHRVYPRASGGTVIRSASTVVPAGLSPRERGNHAGAAIVDLLLGSIPARAGEPWPSRMWWPCRGVYPRASGGTWMFNEERFGIDGLSPRERGNLLRIPCTRHDGGSIPARAGEPLTSRPPR